MHLDDIEVINTHDTVTTELRSSRPEYGSKHNTSTAKGGVRDVDE